jgi:hypothetical protein
VVVVAAVYSAGCTDLLNLFSLAGLDAQQGVRIYLVNSSTSKFVSPNPGLCPQGIENQGHSFLSESPVIAPGQAVTYTTVQIGGDTGVCASADPSFMIGLCGWRFGVDSANLSQCTQKFGGQINVQFQCGDTVILRWTDGGGENGTWSSEVLTAPGNAAPTMAFQTIDGGGSCSAT